MFNKLVFSLSIVWLSLVGFCWTDAIGHISYPRYERTESVKFPDLGYELLKSQGSAEQTDNWRKQLLDTKQTIDKLLSISEIDESSCTDGTLMSKMDPADPSLPYSVRQYLEQKRREQIGVCANVVQTLMNDFTNDFTELTGTAPMMEIKNKLQNVGIDLLGDISQDKFRQAFREWYLEAGSQSGPLLAAVQDICYQLEDLIEPVAESFFLIDWAAQNTLASHEKTWLSELAVCQSLTAENINLALRGIEH